MPKFDALEGGGGHKCEYTRDTTKRIFLETTIKSALETTIKLTTPLEHFYGPNIVPNKGSR